MSSSRLLSWSCHTPTRQATDAALDVLLRAGALPKHATMILKSSRPISFGLTVRMGIAALASRTWATAHTPAGLRHRVEWRRGYHHFIRPYRSLHRHCAPGSLKTRVRRWI